MNEKFRSLKIQAIKAQLAACVLQCESLAGEYETATSEEQKSDIVNRWDRAMNERDALHKALDILEKRWSEAAATVSDRAL